MNSVKNLFVCVMLMGVSYGAYQVISAPDPTLNQEPEIEVLDIQIGSRTDDSPAPNQMPSQPLVGSDPGSMSRSPLSIPPLPKEYQQQNAAAPSSPPRMPELKMPEVKMPELNNSNNLAPRSNFQPAAPPKRKELVQQTEPPKRAADDEGDGGFVPPLILPQKSAPKDPIAFQPTTSPAKIAPAFPPTPTTTPAIPAETPTSDFSASLAESSVDFDPKPQTRLEPVTPKPFVANTNETQQPTGSNSRYSANVAEISNRPPTNPYANLVTSANDAAAAVRDRVENPIQPPRAATEILNNGRDEFGSRAKELVSNAESQASATINTLNKKIDWQGINEMAGKGKTRDALKTLTQYYDAELPQDQRMQLLNWLDILAGQVIYSTEHLLATKPHVVKNGETLESIASAWHVPAQLIYNINQAKIGDPSMLVPGTELKVIPGPFNAVVNVEQEQLTLFLDNMYAGRFSIELGQDGQGIKHGSFMVEQKAQGRPFTDANGQTIAAAAPGNPYGKFWIGLDENLAIHESNPDALVTDKRGSIRLGSRDAADVFGILSNGSQVTVTR